MFRAMGQGIFKSGLVLALLLVVAMSGCGGGSGTRIVRIEVTEGGFVPRQAFVPRGVPAKLVVTRRTDQTCITELVIAGMDSTWRLPLDRAVRIELPSGIRDTLRYTCGMSMYSGMVIAK